MKEWIVSLFVELESRETSLKERGKKMKRLFASMIIISVGAGLIFLFIDRSFSKEDESAGADPSNSLYQLGSASQPSLNPSRMEENSRMPIRLDDSLHSEARRDRGAISAGGGSRETLFHQNMLLDRFQSADSKGQILLSFSVSRVDLMLRSVSGMEAPILSLDWDVRK